MILVYIDVPPSDELRDLSLRLGTVGYFVAMPNLYYREQRRPSLVRPFDITHHYAGQERTLTVEENLHDTESLFRLLDRIPEARANVAGSLAYGSVAALALAAAGRFSSRIRCSALIDPTGAYADALDLTAPFGELYLAVPNEPVYDAEASWRILDRRIARSRTNFRIEQYHGVTHGFALRSQHGTFNKVAAERHWERILAIFRKSLI